MGEYVPTIFEVGMKVFYPSGWEVQSIHLEGEEYILIKHNKF
jgi:co-chaperonin GroES (HSP10)